MSELDYSSATATYGPPYNTNGPPQSEWFAPANIPGVRQPIDPVRRGDCKRPQLPTLDVRDRGRGPDQDKTISRGRVFRMVRPGRRPDGPAPA